MKLSQTVALLLVLVVMVFAVTFAKMYVPQTKNDEALPDLTNGESPTEEIKLNFPVRMYPENQEFADRVISEYDQKGHHDFWFTNDNDKEVLVGLNSKNCTCSTVRLFLASESWLREVCSVASAKPALTALVGSTASVGMALRQKVEALPIDSMSVLDGKIGTAVPPRALGFVRMEWVSKRSPAPTKPENLRAELWTQSPKTPSVLLFTGALLVDPLRLDVEELTVNELRTGDSEQVSFRCWSCTRRDLNFQATSTGAPFVNCQIEPLTPNDIADLQKGGGEILSGCRVRVFVNERLGDGKRANEGPFEYAVQVRADKTDLSPLSIRLRGIVKGEISVVNADSGIRLEAFQARQGVKRQVTLQADRLGLELEMDRHPPFMQVKLEKEPGSGERLPRWRMQIEIAPNRVAGEFPRTDNELYRDTAIYLRIVGKDSRPGEEKRLRRIPVSGTARQ